MTRFPVSVEQLQAELESRDREIERLNGVLLLEKEDREARNETMNRVRTQTAQDCAETADIYEKVGPGEAIRIKYHLRPKR